MSTSSTDNDSPRKKAPPAPATATGTTELAKVHKPKPSLERHSEDRPKRNISSFDSLHGGRTRLCCRWFCFAVTVNVNSFSFSFLFWVYLGMNFVAMTGTCFNL